LLVLALDALVLPVEPVACQLIASGALLVELPELELLLVLAAVEPEFITTY
jgi:hypothetical protein